MIVTTDSGVIYGLYDAIKEAESLKWANRPGDASNTVNSALDKFWDRFKDNSDAILNALSMPDNKDMRETILTELNKRSDEIAKNVIPGFLIDLYTQAIDAKTQNLVLAKNVINFIKGIPRHLAEHKDLPAFFNKIQDPNSAFGTSVRATDAILGQAVDLIEALVKDKDALALLLKRDDLEALQSVFSSFDTSTILNDTKRRIAVDSIRSFSTSVLEQANPSTAQVLSVR
jgi:hypothetical protein